MTNLKLLQDFVFNWKDKGYEKGESQPFWIDLLTSLGAENASQLIEFEQQVHIDHTAFIDGYIRSTKVLIEQKSIQKDLGTLIRQSDGTLLNPFQQAKRYASELPYSLRPRWIVTCNFREFWIYDMEQPHAEPQKILLENLESEYYRLKFLIDNENEQLKREMELSIKAGDLVGKIYDAILPQYTHPESPDTLLSLNQLCVRLVFCLFAEDAGLFGDKNVFHDYLAKYSASKIRRALIDLFKILDTPLEQRDPYLDDDLKIFPYVNGGLFSNENIEIPQFTEDIKQLILAKASEDFDWSEISPTIFGAVFESTLNPVTRRSGGMHYTSIENIHKVIDPLFMDNLNDEFSKCETKKQLLDFQDKLANLKFLDPACGSGNFLTESFISLRRLENKIIQRLHGGQTVLGDFSNPIKVDINQFYGIEINDFAVSVATTALWIAELQMMRETEKIASFHIDPLPLKSYHNIKEGNALRLNWIEWERPEEETTVFAEKAYIYHISEEAMKVVNEPLASYGKLNIVANEVYTKPDLPQINHIDFDYIMGNPPFVGYSLQSESQKKDLQETLVDYYGVPYKFSGKLDYVSGWYYKACKIISSNPKTHAAFVSTNSITQGEQVAGLWKPLFGQFGIHFDFAYPTFKWDSESELLAHVHCVIIGFSKNAQHKPRLYNTDKTYKECKNINGYLVDGLNVYIENRKKPLCDVPEMIYGSKPADGGNLFLSENEYKEVIDSQPNLQSYIHQVCGSDEFINNKKRFCLWLYGMSPTDIRKSPFIMERIQKVQSFRLASVKAATRSGADFPTLFMEIRQPSTDYLIIPRVSSERRKYIPIGYVSSNIIALDSSNVLPNASLYVFGILTSSVHMDWMRAVCGRLKSDYRYSNTIVYNNFPWPSPTKTQKQKIETTAQTILDVRAKYPDCSYADLYDELTMPSDLRKAHQENDRAVMAAYGFNTKMTETECVAKLFDMYEKILSE